MKTVKLIITIVAGLMLVASFFAPVEAGLILAAPSVVVTSNYVGDTADVIMTALKNGNEAVQKGSVYVEADVKKALFIPRLTTADDVIAAAIPTPVTTADAYSWTERSITPASMMFYDTINPRNFEKAWRPFQSKGPLVDRVDNPQIQAAIMEQAMLSVGKQLGKLIWAGDKAATGTPLVFFDGLITRAAADSNTIKPTPAGAITAANVISILEATEAAIPAAIWGDPEVVFHMHTNDYRLYLQAARALDFKGPNIGDAMQERFAGREIRYYEGLPKDRIMVAKANTGRTSNLWAGVDVDGDEENVKIQRYRPESELFIVKVLFKYDVNYGIPEQIVIYKPA